VILFDRDQLTGARRNVLSPAQVATLVGDLRAAASHRPIIVSVDQEGGIVTRLSPAQGYPAVASEGDIGRGSAAAARTWAKTIATTLANAGINFTPVVDLDVNPKSPAIGALDRSFSADPDVVVERATIEIEAHRAVDVRTTLKHFPGIGSSTGNTDAGFVDVTRTWHPVELAPFRSLVQAGWPDAVMVGHVLNGQLDASRPASLSHATVTNLLRQGMGWRGVVVSDDMQAGAIRARYGTAEAIGLAVEAGVDLLVFANQAVYDPGVVATAVDAVAGLVRGGRVTIAELRASADRRARLLAGAV
jgi:beta-N-acetylhexosaminidase